MTFSAWTRDLRTEQGRDQPTGWTPPDGRYVFVLGYDKPGHSDLLDAGDFVQVQQSGSLANVLRYRAKIRPPTTAPPAGLSWRAALYIDGTEVCGRNITRTRDLFDLEWCTAHLYGSHQVAFRLTLNGPSGTYNVELPAFYVDNLILDTSSTRPQVGNRDPEPNDTSIPLTSSISVDVFDVGGSPPGIDSTHTTITVNGVVAVLNGVAQTGFSLVTTTPQTDTTRYVVTPSTPFTSEELVTVRVQAQTLNPSSLDTTYSFTTVRTTPPVLLSAVAIDQFTVRCTWDEAVVQVSPTGANDALNPARWTVTRPIGDCAVSVNVLSVATVSSAVVDLTLDIPMTRGGEYTATGLGIADLFGNLSTAPTDAAAFAGWEPPVPIGRTFDVYSMLPAKNRADDDTGDLARFCCLLQEIADLLLYDVDQFTTIADPDIAPEAFVDAMLTDMGNPFPFAADLALVDKRRLVELLPTIFKEAGVDEGTINVIRFFLGITVTIAPVGLFSGIFTLGVSELGGGDELGTADPYLLNSFDVVSPVALTTTELTQITQIATYMKPARTHLRNVVQPSGPPPPYDPVELGISELGVDFILH